MSEKDRPDTRNAASDGMLPRIRLMRDVVEGTDALRAKRTDYLPKHPNEQAADYDVRLQRAVAFNATKRTLEGLTGFVFRRDIELDVPPTIAAHLEDIDNGGTHIDVFAKRLFEDALEAGHAGILVDAPLVEDAPLSRAAEAARGVRPYWVHVPAEDIISWRFTQERGRKVLDQLVLRFVSMEADGLFGETEMTRYRVFMRDGETVNWQLWELVDDEPVLREEGTVANQTEIPFVVVYGDKTAELESRPPLLDLAHLNIAHYQMRADFWQSIHKANCPILSVSGAPRDQEIEVGPNSAVMLPEGASMSYTEHTGSAHGDTRAELKDMRTDMAILGLGMLQHETRAAETAEAKRIDKSEQDSALATAARSEQDALEMCLQLHANYMRIPDGGTLVVNRDFERLSMDAQQLQVYAGLVDSGKLSLFTLWKLMAEAGSLPDGFDPDEELEHIQSEGIPEPTREAA